jgi:hypothetical protein
MLFGLIVPIKAADIFGLKYGDCFEAASGVSQSQHASVPPVNNGYHRSIRTHHTQTNCISQFHFDSVLTEFGPLIVNTFSPRLGYVAGCLSPTFRFSGIQKCIE